METKLNRPFDVIYLEEEASNYPATAEILQKFPKSEVIKINSYQEIFNRNRQNFRKQKLSPKLILAIKKDNLLYAGSQFTPSFEQKNFFYNAMALNCIYDCSYCYLQGMFNSANLVIFVNSEDFLDAAKEKLSKLGSLYLSISYDTDLLAIEHLAGYCRKWISLCHQNPNLLVESRTKSVNFNAIKDLEPTENFILSWTLSPEFISSTMEKNTPSLLAKIKSIKQAQSLGWKVRICFDPLLLHDSWEDSYQSLIQLISKELNPELIRDFSIGSFRMNKEFLKKIQKIRPREALFSYPYKNSLGVISYPEELDLKLKEYLVNQLLLTGTSREKIFVQ